MAYSERPNPSQPSVPLFEISSENVHYVIPKTIHLIEALFIDDAPLEKLQSRLQIQYPYLSRIYTASIVRSGFSQIHYAQNTMGEYQQGIDSETGAKMAIITQMTDSGSHNLAITSSNGKVTAAS